VIGRSFDRSFKWSSLRGGRRPTKQSHSNKREIASPLCGSQ
jgi:hypothetical protein